MMTPLNANYVVTEQTTVSDFSVVLRALVRPLQLVSGPALRLLVFIDSCSRNMSWSQSEAYST